MIRFAVLVVCACSASAPAPTTPPPIAAPTQPAAIEESSDVKIFRAAHGASTRMPLTSVHVMVACDKCHPGGTGSTGVPDMNACGLCHAARSPHGKRFDAFGKPPACGTCHAASWRPNAFAHGQHTKMSLHEHSQATCRDCHRGTQPPSDNFQRLDAIGSSCGGCHAHVATVIHDGKYTNAQCQQCHTTQTFRRLGPLVMLAHGPAGTFPLAKGHKFVACVDCHTKRPTKPRFSQPESPECSKCHQDSHRGAMGTRCVSCHASGSWNARHASPPKSPP